MGASPWTKHDMKPKFLSTHIPNLTFTLACGYHTRPVCWLISLSNILTQTWRSQSAPLLLMYHVSPAHRLMPDRLAQSSARLRRLFFLSQSAVRSNLFSFSVRLWIHKTLGGFVFQVTHTKREHSSVLSPRLAFISSRPPSLSRSLPSTAASSLTPGLPLCSWWDTGDAGSQPWQWWIWQEESVNDIPPLMAGATSHTFAFPFIILAFIIMGWLPDLITVPG